MECYEGACKVLSESLCLTAGDALALFYDETTIEPARYFQKAAKNLKLEIFPRNVPISDQENFTESEGLSNEDFEALENARGILTCLSSHTKGTAYRKEIVRIGTTDGKRLGHMPGVNLNVLAHAVNINYTRASSYCDDLALCLALGKTASLKTYNFDIDGNIVDEADLFFDLGGLTRYPITSTGIIPLGTWGNLPGGETFIAPIEDTANGYFVLNGAFKNFVFNRSTSLVLEFRNGSMASIKGNSEAKRFFESLLEFARKSGDEHYSALAEFGIGVNPGISDLTGNALFDEKCYGTAHIAIGDSKRYGGRYSSTIHEDLISRKPSLTIDGKSILQNGSISFNESVWRDSLSKSGTSNKIYNSNLMIEKTVIGVVLNEEGSLQLRYEVAAGRVCIYTVGDYISSKKLANLYRHLPPLQGKIRIKNLLKRAKQTLKWEDDEIFCALDILHRHGLVNCIDPDEQGRH